MSIGRVRKHYRGVNFSWASVLRTVFFAIVVAIVIVSFAKIKNTEYFPIRNVKVFGVQHLARQDVQDLLFPFVSKGFFAINIERIRDQVLQLPWAAHVEVRRIWPDRIVVVIEEKKPIALWNDTSLLSAAGELFTPNISTYPSGLPQLVGPSGEQIIIARYYRRMTDALIPLHFKIARLELTPSMAWKITLDNGIKLNIGRKDILTRLNHFVKVYSRIVGDKNSDVEYIDLRYPNGMAVRWKSVT
jgi:cell division protein FtsQ